MISNETKKLVGGLFKEIPKKARELFQPEVEENIEDLNKALSECSLYELLEDYGEIEGKLGDLVLLMRRSESNFGMIEGTTPALESLRKDIVESLSSNCACKNNL